MSIFLNTQTALVQVYVWGAGGGGGNMGGWQYGSYGGGGGFASGKIPVNAGDVYYITVGGGGFARTGGDNIGYKGYTEGGGGAPFCSGTADNRYGGWGGGLSGVFLNAPYVTQGTSASFTGLAPFYTSATTVLIAGGGGGGGSGPKTCQATGRGFALMNGGAGGGLTGQRGATPQSTGVLCYSQFSATNPSGGAGGTQTAPGCAGYGPNRVQTAMNGSQFLGGRVIGGIAPYGAAGGGGWFGGGAGGYNDVPGIMGSGGGGSGYVNQSIVFCGNLVTGCYATPGCSSNVYRGTAGNGGLINGTGANGSVVITYPGKQIAAGGIVTTSSGITIHTFSQSGVFAIYGCGVVSTPATVLIVGGGGGGGDNMGGGGGGGAVINATTSSLSSGVYQITVGDGGLGNFASTRHALVGEYSSIRALTQNSYSYQFQTIGDYLYTGQTAADAYGYGTSRVYFNAMAFTDRSFTLEGWYWLFDGGAPISRPFFTNYAAINTPITTHSIYFGKHLVYGGRVVFWSGTVNIAAPILIDPIHPPTGKWVHYAVSRNGSDFTLFRDGSPVAAATTSSAITSSTVLANYLSLPSVLINSINTGTYMGFMSNVRMVTGGSVYTTGVSPTDTSTNFSGVFNGSYDYISVPGTVGSVGTNDFNLETWVYHTTPASASTSSVVYVDHPSSIGAMSFNGVNSQATYYNSLFAFGTGKYTVEAWIYCPTIVAGAVSIMSTNYGNVDTGFRWYFGGSGFGVRSYFSNWVFPGDTSKVTPNTWHHVAFTRDNGNLLTLWLDGVVHATRDNANPNWSDSLLNVGTGDGFFTGYMRDLRVVKGIALYQQNTATVTVPTAPLPIVPYTTILVNVPSSTDYLTESSGNNWNLNPTGVTYSSLSPFVGAGGSLAFGPTGTASYVSLPANSTAYNLVGDFTFEAWIYPTSTPAGSWGIFDARIAGGSASSWSVLLQTNKLVFYAGASYTGLTNISTNAWTHIVIQRTGTKLMYHINGVLDFVSHAWQGQSPPQWSPGLTAPVIGTKDWSIAGYGSPGYITNIRFVNGSAIYGGQFTPPTAPLTTVTNTTTQFLLSVASPITFLNDSGSLGLAPGLGNTNVTYADVSPSPYTNAGMYLTRNALGKVELATASGHPKFSTTVTSQTLLLPYQWYHLAVSRSGTTTKLFVNGALEATNSNNPSNYSSSNTFNIGGTSRTNANAGISNFTGYMHGLRLTNGLAVYTGDFAVPTSTLSTTTGASTNISAITNQTVLLTLQNSTFIDNSISNLTITKIGTPGIWTNTPFSTSTVFAVPTAQLTNVQSADTNINQLVLRDTIGYPGSIGFTPSNSEYLLVASAPQNALQGDFTIECWVYMLFPPAAAAGMGIIGYGPTSGGSALRLLGSGNTAVVQYWLNGSTNAVTGTTQLLQNKWYHLALQRSGTNVSSGSGWIFGKGSFYFNGTNATLTSAANSAFNLTADFTLEAWVYYQGTAAAFTIMGHQNGPSPGRGWLWTMGTGGDLAFGWSISGNGAINSGGAYYSTAVAPLNQWNHVAFVRSGSTYTFYINGVAAGSGAMAGAVNYVGSFAIGYTPNETTSGQSRFKGYMSNIRIVNGTGIYTTTFTPALASAIPNTKLLLLTNSAATYLVDSSTSAISINSVNVTYSAASPTVYNPSGSSVTYYATGSLSFNGTSSIVTTPQNAVFNFGTGNFTVEGWYYFNNFAAPDVGLMSLGTGAITSTNFTGWWLRYYATGQYLSFYRYDGAQTEYTFTVTGGLATGQWYHIACSRNGTNLRMFLNGTQVGATATSSLAYNNVNSDPFQIGKIITGNSPGTHYLNGYVSNVRIIKGTAKYTENFSPVVPLGNYLNTVLLLLTNNVSNPVIDYSGSQLTLTNSGATYNTSIVPSTQLVTPTTFSEGSLYFVGASLQYLSIPSNTAFDQNTAFTWESWIYPTSISSGYVWGILQSGMLGLGVGTGGVPGKLYVDKSFVGVQITSNTTITANSWYHVAVSFDGTNTRLFLNGGLEGTVAGGGPAATQPLWIGNYNNGAQHFSGYITNFRITKAALYTEPFTPTIPLTNLGATTLLLLVGSDAAKITDSSSVPLTLTNNNGVTFRSNLASVEGNNVISNYVPPSGSSVALYINGNLEQMSQSTYSVLASSIAIGRTYTDSASEYFNGFISNVRIVKKLIYNTTPIPVTPVTADANTQLLLSVISTATYITDSSTLTNTVSTVTSFLSYNMAFSGTANLTVPYNTAFNFDTGDFTVEGWFYFNSFNSIDHGLIMLGTGGLTGANYAAWWLRYAPSGYGSPVLGLYRYNGTTETTNNFLSPTLVARQWYHIACTRNGSYLMMFLNGIALGSLAAPYTVITLASPTNTFANINGSDPITIGKSVTVNGTMYLNGYVSNIRVVKGLAVYVPYPTDPLIATSSTALLLNVASAGTFINDSSIFAWSINNSSGASYSSVGPPISGTNGSILTNSSTHWLGVTGSDGIGSVFDLATGAPDFTIECWVRVPTFPATGVRGVIVQKGWQSLSTNPSYMFACLANTLEYWANNGIVASAVISPDVWYHIAMSKQGTTLRSYLNGVIIATTVGGTMVSQSGLVYISSANNSQPLFPLGMYLSNLRIIKGFGIYGARSFDPTSQALQTTQTGVQVYGQRSIAAISTASYVSLLTGQSSGIADNSTNNFTITNNNAVTTSSVTALSYANNSQYVNSGSIYFPPLLTQNAGSYLTVTNASLYPTTNQDFTVEFFINNGTHRGTGFYPVVFATGNTTATSTSSYSSNVYGGVFGNMIFYAGNTLLSGASTSTYTLQINGITANNTASSQISLAHPILLGSWIHIAITRSSGSLISVFVNGVISGTGRYNGPITSSGNNTWSIGGVETAPHRTAFIGYISNFRSTIGTALYSRNFTPPSSPITVNNGTSTILLLNTPYVNSGNPAITYSYYDSSYWKTAPTTKVATTVAAGPVISILNPFNNYSSVSLLTANNPLMAVDYGQHSFNMIRNGLTTATTFAPFNKALTVVQTNMDPTATTAGYSAWFDGMGSKSGLILPPASQLHLPGDFTIEFWMYANGGVGGPNNRYNNAMYIINKGSVLTSNITTASYEILYTYPNVYFNGSTSTYGATGTNTIIVGGRPDNGRDGLMGTITGPNTWNHIAVARQGNTIRGFVNGVQGLTTTTTYQLYDSNLTGRGLAIGMGFDATWGTSAAMAASYSGNLSNLRIIKNQGIYTGNFTPPTQTLTTGTVGTSGANVAASVTGTTALLMFHTPDPLFNGATYFVTTSTPYNITYFAPIYPQSTNPFGAGSNAAIPAMAMGGGGGATNYGAKTTPATIGANGGAAAACHSVGGAASPGIMGTPGGGYAGAVSTGTYYGAGGGGASSSGYVNGTGTPRLGQGGCGVLSTILGTPYYFGGGGGSATYNLGAPAGSGGVGGGGGGAPKSLYGGGYGDRNSIFHALDGGFGVLVTVANQPGGNGAPNSGGGGGGGSHQLGTYGGNGGSGIVAISYPGAQKALGGVVTTVGTSTVHTFYANGVFTMLGSPIYPQARGGLGGCGYPGGGAGAAGMGNYGGIGGSLGSTGTAVYFGGAGAGGASSSTAFASGGGGASISSMVNELILSCGSAEGSLPSSISGGGANYGGGGAGGAYAAAISGIGCGGSGALLIVYNTTSTTYAFPNPSPVAYQPVRTGFVQYPYGVGTAPVNPEFVILSTGTTCKSTKTAFPNFVSVPATVAYDAFTTGKNINYNNDTTGATINVTRGITAQCVNAGNIQLTTYILTHDMMIKNNDKALPATYNTPGNYQVIQEVNKANDPRLVNARVANFIVGVTGATGTTGTAGTTVNQYWNGS